MAKTNYTKVEEALSEGMLKIEKEKLLSAADENNPKSKPKAPLEAKKSIDPVLLRRLTKIDQELQLLKQNGKDPYTHLKIDPEEMKKFIADPTLLTEQDWEKIKSLKNKIADYKAALEGEESTSSDDDLIEHQRKDQKTKRFNINKKWIPLQ